jgi:putative FmdB family regulatory protein
MPIYEYKCDACGHRFEAEHGYDEKPVKSCPSDGCEGKVSRVFSPPAIVFKGKGWHVNDYSGKKSSAPAPCSEAGKGGSCQTCPAASDH